MPTACPLLGTLDESYNPGPPVEYPSFENHCLAADETDSLLLADQATFCLAGHYRGCPRYRAAQAMAGAKLDARGRPDPTAYARSASAAAGDYAGLDESPLLSDQLRIGSLAPQGSDPAARRRWTFMGAGLIFAVVLFCGAIFALYSGWRYVDAVLQEQIAGSVNTVSASTNNAGPAPEQSAWVVVTATPSQPAVQPPAAVTQFPAAAQQFPAAVPPTPGEPPVIAVDPAAAATALAAATPPNVVLAPAGEPTVDLSLPIPTRRPTPVFDLPTSTPASAELPTATPVPPTNTPAPLGTPAVYFAAAQPFLMEGECTSIVWNVQNVREVYYENTGVDGRGQREECVQDLVHTYKLLVVYADGNSKLYTTTVTMLMPTETWTPTPTFTDVPYMTPTWTPEPPSPTPTPNVNYGVALAVNGNSTPTCKAGARCEFGLFVTNTGGGVDNLLVSVVQQGQWSAILCRQDGVCAANNLAITGVGAGNIALITFRADFPADAAGKSTTYGFQGVSTGSGGSVSSSVLSVEVKLEQ